MKQNLIDEYVLFVHPLILGEGKRLFAEDGTFITLRLAMSKTTDKGVVVATYRPTMSK